MNNKLKKRFEARINKAQTLCELCTVVEDLQQKEGMIEAYNGKVWKLSSLINVVDLPLYLIKDPDLGPYWCTDQDQVQYTPQKPNFF